MFLRIWNGISEDSEAKYAPQMVRVVKVTGIMTFECISPDGKQEIRRAKTENLTVYNPIYDERPNL